MRRPYGLRKRHIVLNVSPVISDSYWQCRLTTASNMSLLSANSVSLSRTMSASSTSHVVQLNVVSGVVYLVDLVEKSLQLVFYSVDVLVFPPIPDWSTPRCRHAILLTREANIYLRLIF